MKNIRDWQAECFHKRTYIPLLLIQNNAKANLEKNLLEYNIIEYCNSYYDYYKRTKHFYIDLCGLKFTRNSKNYSKLINVCILKSLLSKETLAQTIYGKDFIFKIENQFEAFKEKDFIWTYQSWNKSENSSLKEKLLNSLKRRTLSY